MQNFARIAINIAQIKELFDYAIPNDLLGLVKPGSLVTVPFGRQVVQGIVVNLIHEPSIPDVKEITNLVENEPVCTPAQLELAAWMAEENLTSISECLEPMVPPGLSQHADVILHLNSQSNQIAGLTPLQIRIVNLLIKRGDLRGRQIDSALPKVNWRASLLGLIKLGYVTSNPVLAVPSIRPRTIRNASLNTSYEKALSLVDSAVRVSQKVSARRKNILNLLHLENTPLDIAMIYAETGATAGDIKYLADLEIITVGESEVWRDPLTKLSPVLFKAPTLNPAQAAVWDVIEAQISGKTARKPDLLVGVTGSGKTEIYLRAVEAVLAQNKQAIILVPEIALTPQTVRRFHARFPGKVALVHSRLSQGERYDTWRRIRSGELPVIVGARSALFSPVASLGLIVIDECHDESYYQDDFRPHYSAVETALYYARKNEAVIVLGSATPGVEQLFRARREKWNECSLPDRILAHEIQIQPNETPASPGSLPLPVIQIVDMREELKANNRSILSRALHRSIEEVLAKQEQTILFLNRRGSSTYVFCRDCGYVLRCPRCSTQLTYHETEGLLICHICNYRRKMPTTCPDCSGPNIRQFGLGTESLEKFIAGEFPSARILRWDADTARFKGAHDLILEHFSQHRADILIGTKMLAKGLDLPLVTLVGVVMADVSLNLPDFRAAERTFQLLSQVAGRAGRSGLGGKAIFQTYKPEHYAIQSASLHDLEGFYKQEIALREKIGYPPFSRLLRIEFKHHNEMMTRQAAEEVGDLITSWISESRLTAPVMIGPVPCFYSKASGFYRWHILLKGGDTKQLFMEHPPHTWQPREVNVEIVVDPPNVL